MKKILVTLAAVLAFGVASAQVPPGQPQQTQPDPTGTTADDRAKKDADVQNDVLDPAKAPQGNHVTPRKDEIKTRDHVKSTPDPATVKDSTDNRKKSQKKSKRKTA
ncbi:hypothetical protein [Flavobacterium cyanobacteriorum]|nr:hypothetical protein [Flavobacterium cyanobacteriorum]